MDEIVAIAEMGDNIEFNVPMPIRSRCLVYAFCKHLLKSEKKIQSKSITDNINSGPM